MAGLYLPDGCTQADLDRYSGSDQPDPLEDDPPEVEWWDEELRP
ncbi:MAG TPA: hypothetical protein VHY84_27505 [Bryobacteraceae bacterium]|jgi:hypothetical protein|nr:hypothetical protein [Bryobacteraceae bacterium]